MNRQPGSLLSTTINGSRSCYITVKRRSFLSVATILGRTLHISENILNWFWTLFKNVNTLTRWQQKGICLIFKRNIAHVTHRRALRTLIIASADRLKCLFVQAKFTRTFCIWKMHVPMRIIVLLSYPQSGLKALHILIALNSFTLVCNVVSVLVEMVNFAMVKVDNFCKNKLIAA